jgi:hypothetical protein
MTTQASWWGTALSRTFHLERARRSAARRTAEARTTPTYGIWSLVGSISATALAMMSVIVWAA